MALNCEMNFGLTTPGDDAMPNTIAGRANSGRVCGWLTAFVFASFLWVSNAIAQEHATVTIQGKVTNTVGAPIPNAPVHLEHAGTPSAETKTGADGSFTFGGLPPGAYTLSAENAGHRSTVISMDALQPESRRVDLVIDAAATSQNPADATGAMQFSDNPNFTVAAVTDWTAAGGHGSDAVLRTSEALNRQALTLKPAEMHAEPTSAEWKQTENTLRAALATAPQTFEPNHNLGEFYLRAEKFDQAVPPLETAYKIAPDNPANEFDLARALQGNGQYAVAADHVKKLGARQDTADVHRLQGELDEKLGDPLNAVRHFERAVRMDPTEQNYFEWGSELLLHRAVWQARDVFSAGVKAYPKSERMLTALGAALFAGALYDEAAQRLCEASDLNPADPEPYTFMGRIEISAPNPLPCIEQKLARFVAQRPADPLANYFYAMALWKQKGTSIDPPTLDRVQDLLTRAVNSDPKCSDAYLQLGVLQSTRRDYRNAIDFYTKAIEVNPQMSEAHYRLGVAYDRVGDKEEAAEHFRLHDDIEKQQAAAVEKQRREVKQFLVVVDSKKSEPDPH